MKRKIKENRMESVKLSPKKCKIAMALVGHHTRPRSCSELGSTVFQLSEKKTKIIIYAHIYRNTINDDDSQTLLLIFSGGVGTDVCTQAICIMFHGSNLN